MNLIALCLENVSFLSFLRSLMLIARRSEIILAFFLILAPLPVLAADCKAGRSEFPVAVRSCLENNQVRVISMMANRFGESKSGRSLLEIDLAYEHPSDLFGALDSMRSSSLISFSDISLIEGSCSTQSVSLDRGRLVIVRREKSVGEIYVPGASAKSKTASRYEKLKEIILSADHPGISVKFFSYLADIRLEITAQSLGVDNIFIFLETLAEDALIADITNFSVERRLRAGLINPYFTFKMTIVPR